MNRLLAPMIASLTLVMATLDRTPTATAVESTTEFVATSSQALAPGFSINWGNYVITFFADGIVQILIPGNGPIEIYPDGTYWNFSGGYEFLTPEMITGEIILWMLFLTGWMVL